MIGRHRALIPCFRTGDVGAGDHSTFHAEGPVRLTRGTIRSSLDLTGAHLILGEPRAEAEDEQTVGWFALDAAMMRIRERLVLRYRDDALVSIGVANANGTSAIALGESTNCGCARQVSPAGGHPNFTPCSCHKPKELRTAPASATRPANTSAPTN
jgi:hypothetical protein